MSKENPIIGKYWEGHGGIYVGVIRDGEKQWHLIMALCEKASISAAWGEYGKPIKGDFSRYDGLHNTQLILNGEPNNEIASYLCELQVDGHQDFYWPAQYENILLCMNVPEHVPQEWHWSSTQCSAHNAWGQYFEDGLQGIGSKDITLAVRAVRRELII